MSGDRIPTWDGEPIPYHDSAEALRTQIRGTGIKVGAAIFGLARKAEPEALAILGDLTRSPDPHLRRAALEGIGEHSLGREAAEIVLGLLEDSHGFVVRTACDVSAVLGLPAAHDQILGLVDANDAATRISALRALETLWMPSDFENVFARYLKDRSDDVRKQAAWTLNKNVGPEHWQRLFEVWAKDGLPRHRVWACSLAEKFGDRAVLAELLALCSDPDGHVRVAGKRAAQVVAEE